MSVPRQAVYVRMVDVKTSWAALNVYVKEATNQIPKGLHVLVLTSYFDKVKLV